MVSGARPPTLARAFTAKKGSPSILYFFVFEAIPNAKPVPSFAGIALLSIVEHSSDLGVAHVVLIVPVKAGIDEFRQFFALHSLRQ